MRTKALFFAVCFLGIGQAFAAGKTFVADVVQEMAGGKTEKGRIYMSPEGVRMELYRKGETRIQIMLPKQGFELLMDPQQKLYSEFRLPGGSRLSGERPANPCEMPSKVTCRHTGAGELHGLRLDRYELTDPEKQETMIVWWDGQRRQPVHEEFPDGGVRQTRLVGQDSYAGRPVEHWQIVMQAKDGQRRTMDRWRDPDLVVDVREVVRTYRRNRATGQFTAVTVGERTMRNIRLVAPDPEQLRVPADYRKVDPKQLFGQGSGGYSSPGGYSSKGHGPQAPGMTGARGAPQTGPQRGGGPGVYRQPGSQPGVPGQMGTGQAVPGQVMPNTGANRSGSGYPSPYHQPSGQPYRQGGQPPYGQVPPAQGGGYAPYQGGASQQPPQQPGYAPYQGTPGGYKAPY